MLRIGHGYWASETQAAPLQGQPFGCGSCRALVASAALGAILLLAFFVTAGSVASIVVETDKKGRCEERRFDNRTGKIVSSNYVDCDARLADERDTTPSENMSAERMRAILGAFKR